LALGQNGAECPIAGCLLKLNPWSNVLIRRSADVLHTRSQISANPDNRMNCSSGATDDRTNLLLSE